MRNSVQLASRFREVHLNGTWVANTNFKDQLANLTWQQATHKIGSLNTIAALTFHVNYYISGILNVFEGGLLEIRDKYSFDLPVIQSQQDWKNLYNSLLINAEQLAKHIETMSDEKLTTTFASEKYGTYQRNMEAMIEHSYYHLGQISLIIKMQNDKDFRLSSTQ